MSGVLTLIFALSGGVVVGNLYWAQPLLDGIGAGLSVPPSFAGLIITGVQVGYALGALLIVPLGDTLQRHRLIPAVMAVSVLALLVAAAAPSYAVLVLAMLVVGLSSVTGQFLTPLAADLARPEHRGRTIGTVAAALAGGSLAVVFAAAAVSSVGSQSVLVLVQTSVMAIDPKARSRLNTALIVGNFIGGAVGSTLTAILWDAVGWPLTSGAAGAVALVGLIVWAAWKRRVPVGAH